MENSDRVPGGNEQRSPRQVLIDEVNHYATLYAQARKKAEAEAEADAGPTLKEIHAKLSNHAYKLMAWEKACELFWKGKNGHFYYYIGEDGYDLGENGMNYDIEILKLLDRYDPDYLSPKQNEKSKFTTYLANRVKGMSKDYWRKVKKERETQEKLFGGADPQNEITNEPDYREREAVSMFGKFSKVLYSHIEVVGKVSDRAKTKRERFFAYHTRSYVLICDDFADSVRLISEELEKTLSQPYIVYLRIETVKDNEDAEQYLSEKKEKNFHIGAIQLRNWCQRGKLICARYRNKQAMNTYFGKKNLSKEMKEYEKLLHMFLEREANG